MIEACWRASRRSPSLVAVHNTRTAAQHQAGQHGDAVVDDLGAGLNAEGLACPQTVLGCPPHRLLVSVGT